MHIIIVLVKRFQFTYAYVYNVFVFREIATALRVVMFARDEYRWLYAVPLYHFLTGTVKPFERISDHSSTSHQSPQWWGIADFKSLVDRLKKVHRANM